MNLPRSVCSLVVLSLIGTLASVGAQEKKKPAPKKPAEVYTNPAAAGPDFAVQGEYAAEAGNKASHAAQVVALGGGKFDVYFLGGGLPGAGWDTKSRAKVGATTNGGKVTFSGNGWTGSIDAGKLVAETPAGTKLTLKHVERQSPTIGAKAPSNAVILFDGSSPTAWSGGKLTEGNLLACGTTSKQGFATGKLHVEFRTPFQPRARGQGRGNSGVFVLGREIQVLDSFGLDGKNNECGAFSGSAKPTVNMCLPPLSWQTYDVEVKPDGKGKLVASVWHNGVKVHDNYPIANEGARPAGINLQNHGNPVVFRNIWFVETK